MVELLIAILVFFSVTSIGAAILLARRPGRPTVKKRLRSLEAEHPPPEAKRPRSRLMKLLVQFGRLFALGTPSSGLAEELAVAGYHGKSAASVYLGIKDTLLAVGLLVSTVLVYPTELRLSLKIIVIVTAGAAVFFLPNIYLSVRRQKRTVEVRHHLPDMVDLLEICVVAGMGLDMAWNSVADQIRRVSTILADEMALTNLEIHLGAPRAVAMRHMAKRTQVNELSSLVALLVQSERFGTSVSDTLKTFAQSMREQRGHGAQELAEKMAVKLLFPMVLLIFPAFLLVIVGPAAIELFKAMSER